MARATYAYNGPEVHSTGTGTWAPFTVSNTETIVNMWGTSASDVYAVGGNKAIFHRNADGTWAEQIPGGVELQAMGGSGPNDLYLIDYTHVYHSQGDGHWTPQSIALHTSENEQLMSIWALGPNAVYATTTSSVWRSGGDGTWVGQRVNPATSTVDVFAIWGTSPKNLYVATSSGVYHGTAP